MFDLILFAYISYYDATCKPLMIMPHTRKELSLLTHTALKNVMKYNKLILIFWFEPGALKHRHGISLRYSLCPFWRWLSMDMGKNPYVCGSDRSSTLANYSCRLWSLCIFATGRILPVCNHRHHTHSMWDSSCLNWLLKLQAVWSIEQLKYTLNICYAHHIIFLDLDKMESGDSSSLDTSTDDLLIDTNSPSHTSGAQPKSRPPLCGYLAMPSKTGLMRAYKSKWFIYR